MNLDVARRLARRLRRARAVVHLTRDSDRALAPADSPLSADIAARAALADSVAADLLLSIHHNATAYSDKAVQGTEAYWRALEGDGPSCVAAGEIAARLADALGTGGMRVLPGNFLVLRATSRPAVLGEAAYLSERRLARRLRWGTLRDREAAAYYAALAAHFARADSWPRPSPLPPADTAPRDRPRVILDASGGRPDGLPGPEAAVRLAARAAAAAERLRAAGAEAEAVEGGVVEVVRREAVRGADLILSFAEAPPRGLEGETAAVLVLHYPGSAKGRAAAERIAAAIPGAARREASVWILAHTAAPAVQVVGDVAPGPWAEAALR